MNHMPRIQAQLKYQLLHHPTTATQGSNLQLPHWTWNDRHPNLYYQHSHKPAGSRLDRKRLSPRPKSTNSFPHLQIDRCQPMEMETMSPIPETWTTHSSSCKSNELLIPHHTTNSETNYYRTMQQHKYPQVHKIHTTNWSLNQHSVTYVN